MLASLAAPSQLRAPSAGYSCRVSNAIHRRRGWIVSGNTRPLLHGPFIHQEGEKLRRVRPRRRLVSAEAKSGSAGQDRRPVVILPGLGNNSSDYDPLKKTLEQKGFPVVVAEVARADWLRNAAGLLDANYWRGTLKPRPVLDWYLERTQRALQAAKGASSSAQQVTLLGHSAGGWLARLFLSEFGTNDVALLLTLGTPHLPPPRDIPGVVDQTRGLLYYIEDTCPGAYHTPDVRYVCVSGRYLKGHPLVGSLPEAPGDAVAATVAAAGTALTPSEPASSSIAAIANPTGQEGELDIQGTGGRNEGDVPSLRSRIIGQGYKQVCGQADVWGDGVVPEPSALLPGAEHVVLEGVYHSPVGATEERPWYGSERILPLWVQHLYD